MSQPTSEALPFTIDDGLIDEAAGRLDIAGRLAGANGLLLLDVAAPKDDLDSALGFVALALVGLHREIQDDDDLSDIEEALEDPLRAGDQHGIDEACDLYRGLLASRLKGLRRQSDGLERLVHLRETGLAPRSA